MKSLQIQTSWQPALLAKEIFRLERQGRFEESRAALADLWPDMAELPQIEGLEARDAAEIFLRCGSLIGFLGQNKQVLNAQEISKNLLTEARTRLVDLGEASKIAESENYLSMAYWRTGELNEAESWIEEALFHDLSEGCDTRLYSHVIKNLILLSQENYKQICSNFYALEDVFLKFGDDFLLGNLYNNFGVAANELGNISTALPVLELGRDYFLKAGHKPYAAAAENNLSQLYKTERRFGMAHDAINRATKLFKQIKDRTRTGFSLDTKAQIYFAEAKYKQALEIVGEAIKILAKGENAIYLVETLLTKAKTLLHLDDFSAATLSLIDAVDIARVQAGEEFAKHLIREFEIALNEKNSPKPTTPVTDNASNSSRDLKLVLPPSISHYEDYQGVWINNSHLENIGLKPGSLAIVVKETLSRGDLAAICEIENDAVSCGFYDADFGIVCLEGVNSEPQLFDDKKVNILGKIVGFCNSQADIDGNMIVETINA